MVRVYAVTCLKTGRAYIGCSAGKLAKRFREHKCLAKSGKHHAKALVEEWAKFDDKDFIVSVLELLGENPTLIQKREAELKWLKVYADKSLLLNQAIVSFSPTPDATLP
ncbi:MAG: GIY-YIG nuclease family protein [bacterium]